MDHHAKGVAATGGETVVLARMQCEDVSIRQWGSKMMDKWRQSGQCLQCIGEALLSLNTKFLAVSNLLLLSVLCMILQSAYSSSSKQYLVNIKSAIINIMASLLLRHHDVLYIRFTVFITYVCGTYSNSHIPTLV